MRIDFEDGGYIEAQETINGAYLIIGSPRDSKNMIINSAELSLDELMELFSDFSRVRLVLKGK